ncbi:MAG TPA: acyl-CoA dehydrogenase family protein [Candidatus Dormibacteraeota bacterium]|nr:acyl-CoA dehydrogenase family protein [Candidatus Dormibacteraeota bacterium]
MPDATGEAGAFRESVAAALPAEPDARVVWQRLGRAGLLEVVLDDPGEGGAALLDQLLAELDARLPLGVVLSVCVQVATALPLLREMAGRSPLATDVLARALRGDVVVALAVTDAGAPGSWLLDAATAMCETGDGIVLSGGKDWITNACRCDHALVLARHRPARHFTSFRWLLVPAGAAGVSSRSATGALFAGSAVGHLRFDDVRLRPEHLVGPPGRGLAQFARHVGRERLAGALWARSLCRRVLGDTRRFLVARRGPDGSLWDSAAIRERFARCLVELHRIDALCVVQTRDEGARDGAAMMLKAACGESVERILTECVHLRGADAFRDGGEAVLRAEASMFGIAGGATGAMLAGIADRAQELLEACR